MAAILVGRDDEGKLVIDMDVFGNYVKTIANECIDDNELWFAAYSTVAKLQAVFAARSAVINDYDEGDKGTNEV